MKEGFRKFRCTHGLVHVLHQGPRGISMYYCVGEPWYVGIAKRNAVVTCFHCAMDTTGAEICRLREESLLA